MNIIYLFIITSSLMFNCDAKSRSHRFFYANDDDEINGGLSTTTAAAATTTTTQAIDDDEDSDETTEKKCVNLFIAYVNVNGLCEREESRGETKTVCVNNNIVRGGGHTLKFKLITSCTVGESCTFQRRRPIVERGRCINIPISNPSSERRACLSLHVVDPMSNQC